MSKAFFLLVFRVLGWKLKGTIPAGLKKFVLIVAPHTSYWDFPLGIAVRSILRLKTHFLIKAELFKNPISAKFFSWMGGIPVDRGSKDNNFIEMLENEYQSREEFCVTITPEGTRSKVDKWKTGFHRIALAASVPIVMVAFNFKDKVVSIEAPFHPTENIEDDLEFILDYYRAIPGKHPELGVV